MNKLMIIGAGGHGKVVADIAVKNGYEEIAFLDDSHHVSACGGYPVVGAVGDIGKYTDCDFIVAIGNPNVRGELRRRLKAEALSVVTLIHPRAVVAPDVTLGSGTVVMAGAVVNPGATIGEGCIINTCASVDHDNVLEDDVHISVGSHTAGGVRIGDRTWIGVGAIVSDHITICADCMIGAGAVVVKNIEDSGTYVGVPARKMSVK